MNEKTIQIIPAPSNLMYAYDGGTAQPVACLALVELADGDREIRAMSLTNGRFCSSVRLYRRSYNRCENRNNDL